MKNLAPINEAKDIITKEYADNKVRTEEVTEIAKSLEITDSAGVNGKIDIVNGETVQTTYTGKNLFNATSNSHTSCGITLSGDREFIYADGTGSSEGRGKYSSMNLPAGTYTFSAKYISGSITGGFSIYLYQGYTWTVIGNFTLNSNTAAQNYKTFTLTEETEVSLSVYVTTSKSFSNVKIQYQLTQGENADYDFEPYVGGKASPSPDYPQEIKNCGSNVNLFFTPSTASSSYHITTYTKINDNSFSLNYTKPSSESAMYARIDFDITKIKPNTKYTLSKKNIITGNIFNKAGGLRTYINGTNGDFIDADNITFTTPNEISSIGIYFYLGFEDTTEGTSTITFYDIKLEENSSATGYSAYNCGSIDIKIKDKNLFDATKGQNGYINNNGELTSPTVLYNYCSDYIKVDKDENYTISVNEQFGGIGYAFFDNNKTYLSRVSKYNLSSITFQPTQNGYVRVWFLKNTSTNLNATNIAETYNAQIEEGTIATNYVPYKEELITFPLAEGQLLHNGDYLANDGIHSNRKTIIFDGTEDWKIYDTIFHLAEIDDYSPSNNIPNCTHLKGLSNKDGVSTMKQQADNTIAFYNENTSSSIKRVYIKLTSITTLSDFKQWVTDQYTLGNPVILEYDLKEEIITPYTSDQLQALDKLLNAQMYQEKTYIECLDEVKPDLQVQYLYDNKINNYYGKRLDEIEENLSIKKQATKIKLLASGWSSTAPYTQTISIQGLTSDDLTYLYPIYSDNLQTRTTEKAEYAKISLVNSGTNALTVTCDEEVPTVDLNCRLEVPLQVTQNSTEMSDLVDTINGEVI